AAGIVIEQANQVILNVSLKLDGKLVANEDRVAHLHARYPGVIREVRKKLGDSVEVGDVLATVESNQSLQPYQIKSLIKGVITGRHASIGEFVGDDTELFEVSDYSELWAD